MQTSFVVAAVASTEILLTASRLYVCLLRFSRFDDNVPFSKTSLAIFWFCVCISGSSVYCGINVFVFNRNILCIGNLFVFFLIIKFYSNFMFINLFYAKHLFTIDEKLKAIGTKIIRFFFMLTTKKNTLKFSKKIPQDCCKHININILFCL